MSKCPYCSKDLQIEDFFQPNAKENRKFKIGKEKFRKGDYKGEYHARWHAIRVWACPSCDTILSISEWARGS